MFMPPWGEATWYLEGSRYDTEALDRIIDYLESAQPRQLPADAAEHQATGLGTPDEEPPAVAEEATEEGTEEATEEGTEEATEEATEEGTEEATEEGTEV